MSASGADLKFRKLRLADPVPTGRQIVEVFGGHPPPITPSCIGWPREISLSSASTRPSICIRTRTPRFIIAKSDRLFLFEIDDKEGAWPEPTITRETLLAVAGQDPAKFSVWQERKKEADLEIMAGHPADLAPRKAPSASTRDEQDHGGRTVSVLPSKCRKYLTDAEVAFDEVNSPQKAIILRAYPVPVERFDHDKADFLILLPDGYPDVRPDMFYALPWLKLRNGRYATAPTSRSISPASAGSAGRAIKNNGVRALMASGPCCAGSTRRSARPHERVQPHLHRRT